MFQVRPWPNVILHLDGDSFFVSVFQATNPQYKGRPVVTGAERGVATSMSPEAKKLGITRAMPVYEIRKRFPSCLIVNSDYEAYSLFSKKIFEVLHSFSPTVEEYSIDEGFADLKGLRRPLNMTYLEIGKAIKDRIESSLGITISIGISLTKTLAKVASNYGKPSGLTLINGLNIEKYLIQTKIGDIWGIGEQTSSYLKKLGIKTALDFAKLQEDFVLKNLTKPFYETWKELRGNKVYDLDPSAKSTYKSITRSQTFNTPSKDKDFLWSQLLSHIEEAFETARRYGYQVGKIHLYLKTQKFKYRVTEIKLIEKTNLPLMIRKQLWEGFERIYDSTLIYRTTGCTISDLTSIDTLQPTLFLEEEKMNKARKVYPLFETGKVDFGVSLFSKEKKEKELTELPQINIT